MNRQEILNEFAVDENGIIRSPGKFEAEMLYVPYFWAAFLEGMADDEDEDGSLIFDVTDNDRLEFPELAGISRVRLSESTSGFVFASVE